MLNTATGFSSMIRCVFSLVAADMMPEGTALPEKRRRRKEMVAVLFKGDCAIGWLSWFRGGLWWVFALEGSLGGEMVFCIAE